MRPACFLRILKSTFCLYTEQMSSIVEGNSWHFPSLPVVRGGSYGASSGHLRTSGSQRHGALPCDRGAPGDLSRLTRGRPRGHRLARLCATRILETVVKTPGLSSPCTMECGESLLTAVGVRFTPHIPCQTRTDLRLRPHAVDTLLHLAIAPVAPLHRIRGGGQQLVIEKRQGFFPGGRKELLECLAHLGEPQEPTS